MPKTDKPKMMLFKLLAGLHIEADHEYVPTEEDLALAKEAGRSFRKPNITYKAGEVVKSPNDLVSMLGADRFTYMGDASSASEEQKVEVPQAPAPSPSQVSQSLKDPDFNKMSDKELNEYANIHEVDLSKAKNRQDKISMLRGKK